MDNQTLIKELYKKPLIVINFDFKTWNELSYGEGKECKEKIETNCLSFFSTENNAVVRKKDGSIIAVTVLLKNTGIHTDKFIRPSHNLCKMLIADAFTFYKDSHYTYPVPS